MRCIENLNGAAERLLKTVSVVERHRGGVDTGASGLGMCRDEHGRPAWAAYYRDNAHVVVWLGSLNEASRKFHELTS